MNVKLEMGLFKTIAQHLVYGDNLNIIMLLAGPFCSFNKRRRRGIDVRQE